MTATLHITAEITGFAKRVREQLADLPADEVDDLTDGLEADMAEAFAERPDFAFPEPEAYALELRNAAGLPPKETAMKGGIRQSFGGVAESIRLKRDSMIARIRRSPAGTSILDFLVELRPAWWIVRAIVAYMVGVWIANGQAQLVPHYATHWVVLAALVVISVQWGRGRWQRSWMKRFFVLGNVAAAVLLLPAINHASGQMLTWHKAAAIYGSNQPQYIEVGAVEPQEGVLLNGKPVTNIFGYGANGKVLKNIQLFDQDGHPLATSVPGGNGCLQGTPCVDEGGEGAGVWVPSILETGAKAWNVYPMQMQGAKIDESTGNLVADPTQKPENRTSPFIKVPAVLAPK